MKTGQPLWRSRHGPHRDQVKCAGQGCPMTAGCARYTDTPANIDYACMGHRRQDGLWECAYRI